MCLGRRDNNKRANDAHDNWRDITLLAGKAAQWASMPASAHQRSQWRAQLAYNPLGGAKHHRRRRRRRRRTGIVMAGVISMAAHQ